MSQFGRKRHPGIKLINLFLILTLLLGSHGVFEGFTQPLFALKLNLNPGGFKSDLEKVAGGVKGQAQESSDRFQSMLQNFESEYVQPLQEAADSLRLIGQDIKNKDYKSAVDNFKAVLEKMFSKKARDAMQALEAAKGQVDSISTQSEAFSTPGGSEAASYISNIKSFNQSVIDDLRKKIDDAARAGKGRIAQIANASGVSKTEATSIEFATGASGSRGDGAKDRPMEGDAGNADKFQPTMINGEVDAGTVSNALKTLNDENFQKFAQESQGWTDPAGSELGKGDRSAEAFLNFLIVWGPIIAAIAISILLPGLGALTVALIGAAIAATAAFVKAYVVEEKGLGESFFHALIAGGAAMLSFGLGKFTSGWADKVVGKLADKFVGVMAKEFMKDATFFLASSVIGFGTGMIGSMVKGIASQLLITNNITARQNRAAMQGALDAFNAAGGEGRLAQIDARLAETISPGERAALTAEKERLSTMRGKYNEQKAANSKNSDIWYYFKGGFKQDLVSNGIGGAIGGLTGTVSYHRQNKQVREIMDKQFDSLNPETLNTDAALARHLQKTTGFTASQDKLGRTRFRVASAENGGQTFSVGDKVYSPGRFITNDMRDGARSTLIRAYRTDPGLRNQLLKANQVDLGLRLSSSELSKHKIVGESYSGVNIVTREYAMDTMKTQVSKIVTKTATKSVKDTLTGVTMENLFSN